MNTGSKVTDNENGKELILDLNNEKFFKAFELVKNGIDNVFITGKAGTGKTTFLKYVKENIKRNTAIVAYTGVAAINAGGQTIHSFFKIDPNAAPYTPWDKRLRYSAKDDNVDKTTIYNHFQYNKERIETLKALDILIIDEVSMVRADFIDVIDKILRAFGKQRNKPFGGVQILLIGDTFQLPPIEGKEWEILNQFYESPFFFSATSITENPPIQIELDKIYRQNEIDFINLLNRIRINQPLEIDLELLNKKVRPISNSDFEENYIVLCSTNSQVNEINLQRLFNLDNQEFEYNGAVSGIFPKSACVTELNLRLKEGAQVMFLKNGQNYYNGKIGTIKKLNPDRIIVEAKNNKGEAYEVSIGMHTWENVTFNYNKTTKEIERTVIGTFRQYPIKLAWAITIHKSQGLTFEKVILNIKDFTPSGSTYVALSRCTSLNGLVLNLPIQRKAINTDKRVIEYAKKIAPDSLIIDLLNEGKADNLYSEARKQFQTNQFDKAFEALLKAIKYRNDIETPVFRRYLKLYFKYLHYYKSFFKEKSEELRICSNLVKQQKIQISKFENKVYELEKSNSETIRTSSELLKDISRMREQIENNKIENLKEKRNKELVESKLQNEINIYKNEINIHKNELTRLNREKARLESEKRDLKESLSDLQLELLHQKSLNWFDKLMGKK